MKKIININEYRKEVLSEWEVIARICQSGIKRNGFSNQQVMENAQKLLKEVIHKIYINYT